MAPLSPLCLQFRAWVRHIHKFHHRRSGAPRGEQRGVWAQRGTWCNWGGQGKLSRNGTPNGTPTHMHNSRDSTRRLSRAMPSGCTSLPESPAARCSQCLQSQTHLPPRLILIRALHPTLQDSCRGLPSSAGSAKKPTQNSFVRASLGQATQPRVPQPSLSNCGPRHPPPTSPVLSCSKESDLPSGKLGAFKNPPYTLTLTGFSKLGG